ncbi:MAG: hypothetical protein DRG73_01295 [Deltaproteobacteria bacterium]|nr:MAG: hypothetical protein DRG73_01295 [Deltaproteobacteria bacterium]
MVDVSPALVGKGLNNIRFFLDSHVNKGKMNKEEMETTLSCIHTSSDLDESLFRGGSYDGGCLRGYRGVKTAIFSRPLCL